jgi:hypothetical protein
MATKFQLTPEELRIIAENGSPRDRAAAASGQFAQTFNQSIANQGARARATPTQADVRRIDNAIDASTPAAPPKANAAPSVNKNIGVGLMEALNNTEAELVKQGVWEVANRYSVEFAPAALGDARVTKGGTPNKAKVPMQQSKNPADKVNPASNSADYDVRTFPYRAGTPIVVILNEILKNSTYIADQAAYIVDEPSQETKPQKPLGNLMWYKISVRTTPIEPRDKKRNDYAYDITYVISAYPINSMQSEYFPESKIRGRHKSYKYWFTGQNTQVLKFEQKFNSLYTTTFSNPKILTNSRIENNRESRPREYQAAVASSSSQGAEGLTNSIGASAADYLYSKTDIANCELNIVGDPAWLQQGEAATGVSSANFNFNPFNDDGSINFDAQEIIFDLQWNPGVDYDLTGTGLANPNVSNTPQAIYTYKASECVSRFSKGKFEQTIVGVFIDLLDPGAASATATKSAAQSERDDAAAVDAAAGVRPAAAAKAVATPAPLGATSVTTNQPTSAVAKGTQQLLNPPQTTNPSLTQLTSSQAYISARRSGATPQAALDTARQSFSANGTGSVVPVQKINRDT